MAITFSPPRPRFLRGVMLTAVIVLIVFMYGNLPTELIQTQDSHPWRTVERHDVQQQNLNSDQNDPKDFTIIHEEHYHRKFTLQGSTFKETGPARKLQFHMTSRLLHSFSPALEEAASVRFVDPARGQIYFANSPAVTWFNGELVLVCRIWLDRERYEAKKNWPANHFADNYLFTQKFDRHLRPINNGSIMGIPMPKQWWVGDGPIEPRIYKAFGKLYVTFNGAMDFRHHFPMDFTVIWDVADSRPIIPNITGGTLMTQVKDRGSMPRDKHWMPFTDNGKLYFVQNLDPFRVMHCTQNGKCDFVHYDVAPNGFIFSDKLSHLRGGTPFELYKWPYYISVAHCTMYKKHNRHRFYTAHLVVISVKPYRVVYVSAPLEIHHEIYYNTPMVRAKYIDDGFIFPVGIILENRDTMDIGVHINDHSSVLLRFTGLENLMKGIISVDKKQAPKKGPPVFTLHKFVKTATSNATKIIFYGA